MSRLHTTVVGGGISARLRSLRANLVRLAAAVAVIAAFLGTAVVIRAGGARKDVLRRAEIAAAVAPGSAAGVVGSPEALLHGQPVAPLEYAVSAQLRHDLREQMIRLVRLWPTAQSRRAFADASALDAQTVRLMEMIRLHQLRQANALENGSIGPLGDRFAREMRQISQRLETESNNAEASERTETLLAVGLASAMLLVLLVALISAERRRERHDSERRVLEESERRLNALVHNGSDVITVAGANGSILYQGGAVQALLGHDREDLEGTLLSDWVHPDDANLALRLCAQPHADAREVRLRHRDGSYRTCEARATSLMDNPAWGAVVLNIWDITERKALEERLRHQAFHDALTGLPNRVLFADRLEQALARARHNDATVAMLLIDLDDFKAINDSLGHEAGDHLLSEIADRLRDSIRASDTVARLGGDEFAVILEDDDSPDGIDAVVERIRAGVAEPVQLGERCFPVTASVGIVTVDAATSASQMVRDADVAMYMAKAGGKNRCALFEPAMHLAIQERLELKADLLQFASLDPYVVDECESASETVLETIRSQFELHFQPLVDLGNGEIVGFEALLRWNHPTRGMIPPDSFIPLAEEIGAIVPLGRWVLEQACQEAQTWPTSEMGSELTISVNVSPAQLDSCGLLQDIENALTRSGLAADRLVLEITEQAVTRDVQHAAELLEDIKKLGIRTAIDDFGTGYSSLSQMANLPIDVIKVEQNLTGTPDPAKQAALIKAVVGIADDLNLITVAERVETGAEASQLRHLGCSLGQGYLFSKPVPAAAVSKLLKKRPVRA